MRIKNAVTAVWNGSSEVSPQSSSYDEILFSHSPPTPSQSVFVSKQAQAIYERLSAECTNTPALLAAYDLAVALTTTPPDRERITVLALQLGLSPQDVVGLAASTTGQLR